jgi:CheY-like chemotaxis protein
VQQQEFDLVLMDLQMPEMDGYEASRQIRKLGGKYLSLPIIALTASAMLEVREKVMQYGMNDYITKPFNPNELYQKIFRFTHPNPVTDPALLPPNTAIEAASVPQQALFSLTALDDLIGDDAAARRQILDYYISALREFILDYRHYLLEAPDVARIRFINHRIKANLNMIQADELIREIAQGEICVQGSEPRQEAARSVTHVTRLCELIISGLEKKPNENLYS